MKLLLDTHTLIWWDNDQLPGLVVQRIQRAEKVYVSAASAWEVAIKSALGKITAPIHFNEVLADYGFCELPISIRHADKVRTLPHHHRDPFDRLLVAQALLEDLVLVTHDSKLRKYKVPVAWD